MRVGWLGYRLQSRFDRRSGEQLGSVFQSNVLVSLTLCDNAIVKVDTGSTAAQFTNHKGSRRFLRDVKSLAVPVRSKEHVILDVGIDRLAKCTFEVDHRLAVREMSGARVFEPVFRTLDGVKSNLAGTA